MNDTTMSDSLEAALRTQNSVATQLVGLAVAAKHKGEWRYDGRENLSEWRCSCHPTSPIVITNIPPPRVVWDSRAGWVTYGRSDMSLIVALVDTLYRLPAGSAEWHQEGGGQADQSTFFGLVEAQLKPTS